MKKILALVLALVMCVGLVACGNSNTPSTPNTPSNPSNEFPRPIYDQAQTHQVSLCYQDSSYLRLRTLSFGYTLPNAMLKKLNVKNLRFAVTATNLFTMTDYLSYSPETGAGAYPEPRQWAVSVNLNF